MPQTVMKFACIWLKQCKATRVLHEQLDTLPTVKKQSDQTNFITVIPVSVLGKIEKRLDDAAKYANIQALYATYDTTPASLKEAISIAAQQKLYSLGDRVKCSNTDEYNAVKRQLYFAKVLS